MKKKLLILGSNGLLGSEFFSKNYLPNWEILAHSRTDGKNGHADLSKASETIDMLEELKPDALLNLVALTNVDYCELFPHEAYISNVKTIENVVMWIKQTTQPIHLVHVSTDQIYDGVGPHLESDISLRNYYAFSKYAGELAAISVNATIIRTNFFGRSKCIKRSSLTDWLFSSLTEDKNIEVFSDVMFSPLSMMTLCEMIGLIFENQITGIYNLGSREGLSKADFAYYFAKLLKLNTSLMSRRSIDDVDFLKTYRPRDMRLNVNFFENVAGISLPSLTEEIQKIAKEYSI